MAAYLIVAYKQRARRGLGSQFLLRRHIPHGLTSSHSSLCLEMVITSQADARVATHQKQKQNRTADQEALAVESKLELCQEVTLAPLWLLPG